jgi:CHAT domain-containing protein
VADDETLLFIGRADLSEPHVEHIPVGRTALAAAVSIGLGDQRVYGPLVAPIVDWADPNDLVWVVPHDVLHQVALHAVNVANGQPLIARNPVCYTPSASTMPYIRPRGTRGLKSAAVFADSRADRPLLHADAQAATLEVLFDDVTIARGGDVTRVAVESALSTVDVVHVACHGEFDPDQPLASGFLLAEPDGRFTAADFLTARMNAGLVTLSACESGVNQRRAGDELIGLTRAILYAGAASVLVTLWSVDEISTGFLMSCFYGELGAGKSKAAALRAAQLRLRDLTVWDAITYCEEIRPKDKVGARLIDRDIADLRYVARDFEGALENYRALAADGGDLELAGAITRCQRALRAKPEKDYDMRPYTDPYFWAPFVLIGDWR